MITSVGLRKCDKKCPLENINVRIAMTGNEPNSETSLHIDLEETIECALKQIRTLLGHTPTGCIKANWMNFDVNWTLYSGQAGFNHHRAGTVKDVYWLEKRIGSRSRVSTTEP